MSNKHPIGTAGNIMADYVQRLLRKQFEQGKIQFSQLEGNLSYHQMPPGSTDGGDPSDPDGGSTVINSTPTGSAGGDVNGTYPSSLTVVGIRGNVIEDVEPPDGGILYFDLDSGMWKPGPPPSGGSGGGLTVEEVDDRVAALLVAGAGIALAYDDTANTLTVTSTVVPTSTEDIDDRVNALLVAGTGITKTYDDAANTLTLAATVAPLSIEEIDDRVASLLVAGTGITTTYDDAAGTLTLAATGAEVAPTDVPRVLGAGFIVGTLTVGNDVGVNLRLDADATLSAVRAYCKTAATGNGTTIDVKRSPDGSTFTSLLTAPLALASGARTAVTTAFPDTTLDAGDYIRLDVLTVPSSGSPPADVTVQLDMFTSGLFTVIGGGEGSGPHTHDWSDVTGEPTFALADHTHAGTGGTDTHTVGATPPASPLPGDIWLDTSGDAPPAPSVITSGLIWGVAMSEGSGQTVQDVGPNNYDLTLGTTTSVEGVDPTWVTAGLSFDASTSDQAVTGNIPDTGWLGPLTVMVVANIAADLNSKMFLSKSLSGNGSTDLPIALGTTASTSKLYAYRSNTGDRRWEGGSPVVGAYHVYSVVYGSADITVAPTFYTDTVAVTGTAHSGSGPAGPPTGTATPLLIGKRADASYKMNGVISYVLVYSRALSAGEIATNYAALQTIMAGRGVTLP